MQRIPSNALQKSKSLPNIKIVFTDHIVNRGNGRAVQKQTEKNDEIIHVNWMKLVEHEIFETQVTIKRALEKKQNILKLDSLGAFQTFDFSKEDYIEALEVGTVYGILITPPSLTYFSAESLDPHGKLDLSQSTLLTEKTICLGTDYCKKNVLLPPNINL